MRKERGNWLLWLQKVGTACFGRNSSPEGWRGGELLPRSARASCCITKSKKNQGARKDMVKEIR